MNNNTPFNSTTSISFTYAYNSYINLTVSNGIVAGAYTTKAISITAIYTTFPIGIAPYTRLNSNFATTTNNSGYQIYVIKFNAPKFKLNISSLTTMLGFIYTCNRITITGTFLGKTPNDIYFIDTCIYMKILNYSIVNNNNFSQFNI